MNLDDDFAVKIDLYSIEEIYSKQHLLKVPTILHRVKPKIDKRNTAND